MNQEKNVETEESKTPPKKTYRGFTLRQRLVPVILLALALGLTLCLIGPYDIFFNNIQEFLFSGGDFALWTVAFFLVLAGAVCGILLPLRGRGFDVTYGVFFALALMLFVQGNYLNVGLNSLAADGLGENENQLMITIVNTIVWVLVIAGCVVAMLLIKQKHREILRTVGTIAMVTVIGMQMIPLAVSALTAEKPAAAPGEDIDSVLTYENFNHIGEEKNIFYFVVDRFDYGFYQKALAERPELFEELEGFTDYEDMVSLYPRTYPAVPYMLTGVEHDFLDLRTDYLDEAYESSPFLKLLRSEGYEVNIYTDDYYGYNTAESMEAYASNTSEKTATYRVVKRLGLSWDMVRLSLYRYFPFCIKGAVGDLSTPEFKKYISYATEYPKYSTDMRDAYVYLEEHPLELRETKKQFSFVHLAGCHVPNVYDENFKTAIGADRNDSTVGLVQSFKVINQYLKKLKELGLYENATIVITGDHASLRGSDTALLNEPNKQPFLTALFVKPAGVGAGEPMKISSAPIAQADIIPTILQSEGIGTELDFGRSVFEVEAAVAGGEVRERRSVFHSLQHDPLDGSINYEEIVFKIVGSGKDLKNWIVVSRGNYVGNIYQ